MAYANPNISRPYELLTQANTYSSGILTIGFLLVLGAILFIYLEKENGWKKAFGASSMVILILGIFLNIIGAMGTYPIIYIFIAACISLVILYFDNK